MATQEPVGSMHRRANSGSGEEDGPEFIRCVDRQQPQIHEVWTFTEDGVTREIHPTAGVDVGAGFVGEFATDCSTPIWRIVSLCSEEIPLMEASSGLEFLTSRGTMDRLGLSISWLLMLVGEIEGPVPI